MEIIYSQVLAFSLIHRIMHLTPIRGDVYEDENITPNVSIGERMVADNLGQWYDMNCSPLSVTFLLRHPLPHIIILY